MEVVALGISVAGVVVMTIGSSVMGWLCCRKPVSLPGVPVDIPQADAGAQPQAKPEMEETTREDEIAKDESQDSGIVTRIDSVETFTVKVEVHSSSSGAGSDENMSSSDLSERGSGSGSASAAGADHDYEDIYLVRNSQPQPRSRSRDSGSHSRSNSVSSTQSNIIIHTVCEEQSPPELPMANGFNGCSKSQIPEMKSTDEQKAKTKLNHSHSMPYHQSNSRALKRVVSEPGSALPPPPPPPPPEDLSPASTSLPSSPEHSLRPEPLGKSVSSESPPSSPTHSSEEESTLRANSVTSSASATDSIAQSQESSAPVHQQQQGPNLVNKQMVLPFIPPKFPSSDGDEHSLIKPSEYLRALGTKPPATPTPLRDQPVHPHPPHVVASVTVHAPAPAAKLEPLVLPQVHSFQPEDKTGCVVTSPGPPPPPLPASPPAPATPTTRKADQPLGTISIQDLNSVQLRRTNKLSKTMSAPLTSLTGQVEAPFQCAKQDLIEELKKSKDITGIKKMKVEKVKMEEQHEKELVTEIAKHLSVDSFVEKIPDKDTTGNPIPPWKRQMLAKKAAEKARKEMEEVLAREAEERRLQSIPAWKRQLLQSKKPDDKPPATYTAPIIDDKKPPPTVQIIENTQTKENKENNKPEPVAVHDKTQTTVSDEAPQIMPWRAQLRKTNSTLNLLE